LLTVRQTAVVRSPRASLSIPQKGRTGNVVMDAISARHICEKNFPPDWYKRRPSNRLLVADTLNLKPNV